MISMVFVTFSLLAACGRPKSDAEVDALKKQVADLQSQLSTRADAVQKEQFRAELKNLLVDAEQLNLRAKDIFTNTVLKKRAHDEDDLDEAVQYEREANRVRRQFESEFLTLKTRFEHMSFPSPAIGRAEFATAVRSWERLMTDYSAKAAIDAEMQFADAKRLLEVHFH